MSYINSMYGYGSYNSMIMGGSSKKAEETDGTNESGESSSSAENETTSSGLSDYLDDLLDKVYDTPRAMLSFEDVEDKLEELREEFDDQVLADLKELGVNTDIAFKLSYDSNTGAVTASSNHPDKDKIEAYFNSNPERTEQFKDITDLQTVTGYASSTLSTQDFKAQMTMMSMSVWLSTGLTSDSFTGTSGMDFSSMGSSAYQGLNLTV